MFNATSIFIAILFVSYSCSKEHPFLCVYTVGVIPFHDHFYLSSFQVKQIKMKVEWTLF